MPIKLQGLWISCIIHIDNLYRYGSWEIKFLLVVAIKYSVNYHIGP